MLRSLIRLWALVLILMSSQAFGLGLGDIRLDSALNEPLRAEILLTSATPEELDNLTVQMAPPDIFERYGLDRPAYLASVSFRVFRSGRTDGNIIRLTSSEPITEPFLTFLVEASWSRGRLLREYTVLLDPPTFAPPSGESITQTVQPPVQSRPADSGQIQRPAPAPTPAPAPVAPRNTAPSTSTAAAAPQPAQPAPTPASFDTTPGGDYVVQRGDTLWGLASRMRPDNRLTINQTMVAIFEANPEAFANNINVLSAGASLRIPSADEVFRITRADAIAEVQRQNSAWEGGDVAPAPVASAPTPQPSLELVPPDEDSVSSDDGTAVYDGPDLAEPATTGGSLDDIRIAEIEDLLEDQQAGLVVINDNELTALRRELAELRGEPIPEDPVPTPEPDAVASDDVIADDEIFIDDEEDTVAADDAAPVEAVEEPAVETSQPTPPAPAPAPQPSLMDTIMGYLTGLWGMVGLAVLLVLAAIAFFLRRSRTGSGGDDDATALWQALDDESLAEEAAGDETSQMRAPSRNDETIVVEEGPGIPASGGENLTATMEIPAGADNDDEVAATGTNEALEDTFSSDTALNLDQSDPIAEADFHMAYGLYDQAADLINGALAVDSQRPDLLAKLCEIYFVWGNRDAFVDAAVRFKDLLGDGDHPEWDKTVIMGQQIASDHALFSDVQGATKAVDLAFDDDAGDAALDMDLAGDDEALDDVIDLGADNASAAATNDDSALDFMFGDDGAETEESSDTEQIPSADALDLDLETATTEMPAIGDPTAEMPTVESSLDETSESPTIEDQLSGQFADLDATGELPGIGEDATSEMPAIGDDEATTLASLDDDDTSSRPIDATAEIDLDDLGLDLDTETAGLDETSTSQALDLDALDATGMTEALSDADPTGRNAAVDDDADLASETSLLEATGQTQILPEDFAVETGTGTNIEQALAEDDTSMLTGGDVLADDAETLLASLDDEETEASDFDFAKTEALPSDSFTPDLEGAPGSTDMDLDLDDLTAALKVSAAGDTVDQIRDDATVEQPRPGVGDEDTATAALAPDELSDDLHDARTMTEVGTKLDLARAYVDMGDPGGARSILEEVLEEGDESQRQQAQQLLDSLPA